LANTLLLDLEEIGGETLEMLAYLPLASLLVVIFFVGILLNYKDTYSQATNPNSAICRMSLAILSSKGYCLVNTTILRREHMTFLASSFKY